MTIVAGVGAPVWGTFSVMDHCRPDAFLREVLLFDRLAVPYPDPNFPAERDRWRRPNPANPSETWNPERLDQLLSVLGTEDHAGYNGARMAQRVWLKEKAIVKNADVSRFCTRVEVGCVSIGTARTVGLACLAALPVVGAGAGLLAFLGWGINKWKSPKPARSLGGAAMFVQPTTRLDWLRPTFDVA